MDQQQILRLIYAVVSLIIVLPAAIYIFREKTALRNLTIWVALIAALMWGYHIIVEKPQLEALPSSLTAPTDEAPATPPEDTPEDANEPAVRHL